MRNHRPIEAMRRRGEKPAGFVTMLMQSFPKGGDWACREFCAGKVFVEPSDAIERLDLRFLVGCDVMVDGENAETVRALFAALQRHRARRVIANCGGVRNGNGYLDFILDSEGVLTWQA